MRQEGIDELAARQKILRGSPDLRQRLVEEANRDRPQKGTRPRPDLADKAAALRDVVPAFGGPVN